MTRRLTCRELIDFLDDYVEGALPAAQRALFDDHLGRCAACVRYLRGYQGTLRAVALSHGAAAAAPPDVPEELLTAILAARRARAGA
jgi:anti-sigma factor RsiW